MEKYKLFVRHAEKEYQNGSPVPYRFDPHITEQGRIHAKKRFRHFYKIVGNPDMIICSPYLRTRETAQVAQEVLLEEDHDVPIYCDSLLSEYLREQWNAESKDFHRSTWEAGPPILSEDSEERRERVKEFIENIDDKNVWYVSHGVFLKEILHMHGYKRKHISVLDALLIKDDEIERI